MMAKRTSNPKRIILLTKEDRAFIKHFEESSQAHVDKVTKTRETAVQDLIDAGIFTRSGKLAKQYRSVA